MLKTTIERIQKMEVYFDILSSAIKSNPQILKEDVNLLKMLCELTSYYESGQWLKDFESDERGELPKDLKRGVLSEDGVYNLLSEFKE
ncbi:MAG: DUF4298 domain-containing protein [Phascolarctobacterium sp.]|nr:DUF4298 domain-containing protein [Phascolarctobacterium sp.]MBQ3540798.1 DUF4298 domain-containing protein [Phascolarctobacterium sp.]MBQ7020732.1 DUF4298 domain-containing protein [Phascolarctobacterium sp.]